MEVQRWEEFGTVRGQLWILTSTDVFGANRGPRPSADGLVSVDSLGNGLAFSNKMKTFWVIKYLNIYSTNK